MEQISRDREVKRLACTPLEGFHLTWKLMRCLELVIYHSRIAASYSKQQLICPAKDMAFFPPIPVRV
jgi:hypothetical protein